LAKASNGKCDAGGEGSETYKCLYGDDSSDCGTRECMDGPDSAWRD